MHPSHVPGGDLSYFIEYVERAAAFESFTTSGLHSGLRRAPAAFCARVNS